MNNANYFLTDNVTRHVKLFRTRLRRYREVVVINADQDEATVLITLLQSESLKGEGKPLPYRLTLIPYTNKNAIVKLHDNVVVPNSYSEYSKEPGSRTLFIFFKNKTMDINYAKEQFDFFEKYIVANTKNRMLYVSESYIDNFKWDTFFEVSEEEYADLIENQLNDCTEKADFTIDERCRDLFNSNVNITVIRYNNLFGTGITPSSSSIASICERASKFSEIVFTENDKAVLKSHTYIDDLLVTIAKLSAIRTKFYIYNLTSYIVDDWHIKTTLSLIATEAKLKFPDQIISEREEYCILQRLKINHYAARSRETFLRALECTLYSMLDNKAIDKIYEDKYARRISGKIDIIRSLEIDILREVDRICRKYGLTYFLIGGSLLGTIRHKGFIPWDDDLDIGMLRDDYEKFRRIAPQELDKKFYYQSYRNHDGSHYIFDKIRVNDTLFSTAWSSHFHINDGIFVDILCYDKTSNYKVLQKLHITLIRIVKRAINIKWINFPRKNIHYRLSKIVLPILRLIPFDCLHFVFEKVVKLYSHSKKSHYLLDSLGMNIKKVGAFPVEWFQDMITGEFAGQEVPITKAYDEYLKLWYGKNYMELLPLSKRMGHKIVEMNVGKYAEKSHR